MTLSVTVPTGLANKLMVICVQAFGPGPATAVTWNGASCTNVTQNGIGSVGSIYEAEIWEKFSPQVGTFNVSVTWSVAPGLACITVYLLDQMDQSGTTIHNGTSGVSNTITTSVTQLATKTELVIASAIFQGNGTGLDVFFDTSGTFLNDTSSVGAAGTIQVGTSHFITSVPGTTTISDTWSTSDASSGGMALGIVGWVVMSSPPVQTRLGPETMPPYIETPRSIASQQYVKPPVGVAKDTKIYSSEFFAFPVQANVQQSSQQLPPQPPIVVVGNSVYNYGGKDVTFYMPPPSLLMPTPTNPILPGTYKDTRFLYKYARWGHR